MAEGHPRLILRTVQGLEPSCQDLTEGHGACNKTFASQTELPGARPCGAEPRQRPAAEGRANISAGRAGEPRARLTWLPGLDNTEPILLACKTKIHRWPGSKPGKFRVQGAALAKRGSRWQGLRAHARSRTNPACSRCSSGATARGDATTWGRESGPGSVAAQQLRTCPGE